MYSIQAIPTSCVLIKASEAALSDGSYTLYTAPTCTPIIILTIRTPRAGVQLPPARTPPFNTQQSISNPHRRTAARVLTPNALRAVAGRGRPCLSFAAVSNTISITQRQGDHAICRYQLDGVQ